MLIARYDDEYNDCIRDTFVCYLFSIHLAILKDFELTSVNMYEEIDDWRWSEREPIPEFCSLAYPQCNGSQDLCKISFQCLI